MADREIPILRNNFNRSMFIFLLFLAEYNLHEYNICIAKYKSFISSTYCS